MSFLSRLFGGGESKTAALEAIAAKFDVAKKEFLNILIEGLSDPDPRERQGCANLIRDKVIPALSLDPNPASKAASLETIGRLMSELRPPRDNAQMSDLNNAAFHYMCLQLRQQNEK